MKLAGVLLLVAAVGCVPSWRDRGSLILDPIIPRDYKIPKIVGEALSEDDQKVILDAFSLLPKAMVDSLDEVKVRSDVDHFISGQSFIPIGHRCVADLLNRICLRKHWVKQELVWHETAHAYHHKLDKYYPRGWYEFHFGWIKIAGKVYEEKYGIAESEGVLTSYGRTNLNEDIAEWVEKCYEYLYLNADNPVFKYPWLKTDPRYRQKLELLYRFGFFNSSDYQKLKPLFQ